MATYLELCQQVRRECGITGTESTVVSQTGQWGEIVALVAKAELEIQTKWKDWRFRWDDMTITTVIGQAAYTSATSGYPSDLSEWNPWAFIYNDGTTSAVPLKNIEFSEWRKLKNQQDTDSTPCLIAIKPDSSLVLWPPPDAAVTLYGEYSKTPTKLAADATVSSIPVEFHDIIVARAKMMWAEAYEAPEIYQSAGADFTLLMQRLEEHSLPNIDKGNWSEREELLTVVVG